MRIDYNHSVRAAVQGLTPLSRILSSRVRCLPRSPSGCAAVELIGSCSDGVQACHQLLVLETLGRDSGAGECQMPVTDPTCPDLPSDLQFVAASAEVHEGSKLCTKTGFCQH